MTEVTGHLSEVPIDFFADQNDDVQVSENTIERLTGLANAATDLRAKIDEMTFALAEEQEALLKIIRVQIPNIMAELGMKEFKMEDGRSVSVDPKLNVSIPEQHRPTAFRWLEEHNFDGIIKTKVQAEFGKGEIEDARKARDALADAGYSASLDRSIHPATLKSFVKERLGEGETLPDAFSIFEYNEAAIKSPKGKKKK